MNRIMIYAMGVLSAIALAAMTGCVVFIFAGGAAVGVSGAVWYHGELKTTLAGPLPRVRDAALATLKKMGNGVSTEGSGDLECSLISYTGDGRKINVELKSLSVNVTEVHVRIGFWGDHDLSKQILEDIDSRLGKAAFAGPPASALEGAS